MALIGGPPGEAVHEVEGCALSFGQGEGLADAGFEGGAGEDGVLLRADARASERIVVGAMMAEILTEGNLRSQFAAIEAGCSSRKPKLEAGLGEGARAG